MVVMSEIMYHPAPGRPEFIEIHNNTATPLDMADWTLGGGLSHRFPEFSNAAAGAAFLKAFERIVVSSADESTTRAAYTIPASVRVFGPWSGSLNDSGDRVTLRDKNGIPLCTVEYADRGHWPVAADGAGHSLVLRDPNKTVDDWRNWTASQRPGGTPGTEPIAGAETPVINPEVNLTQGIVLVDYGDVWRYDDRNQDRGVAWRDATFNDSGWAQGPGLFGFESAALPSPGIRTGFNDADQLTYYLRRQFVYNGDPRGVTLTLDQIVDDGVVYYLNGIELGRSRMPAGTVTFSTPASGTVSDAAEELAVLTSTTAPLVQGNNVLAVEVHQVNTTSSDVVFGARLRASVPVQSGVVLNEVLPAAGAAGFIEFYNPGSSTVSLRDHYLSDNAGSLRKFRIPSDLRISPRGFGAIEFAEAGFVPAATTTVYLTAPDGITPINAISAAVPLDGRSLGRKPAGSASWFLFTDATRNAPNASQSGTFATLKLNEVHWSSSNTVDWVEIHNQSATALTLEDLLLSDNRLFDAKLALHGEIEPHGFATATVNFPADGGTHIFLATGSGTVLDAAVFERPRRGFSWQAFPDGNGEWYSTGNETRNLPNAPDRTTSIVINEVMFDPPSNQIEGEYLELFNRGAQPVDLSGWRLAEAIDFTFPLGTTIAPGGYLAVAANAARVKATYGNVPVVGDYEGRLGNNGELIRLLDDWGNLADEVDYKAGGDWPDFTRGGGSSLELAHPDLDNRWASAWRDSDEPAKPPLRSYSYRDTFRQLRTLGGVTDYKEIYFHLVGDGHLVLENVQFIKLSAGTNLLVNGGRISTNGLSASGWLCQGTHALSFMTNGQFHIISTGRGDNRPNRVEIDATGMNTGDLCEIRFDARWVSGNPRLIFSTWDHSVANSFLIEVPNHLGTPGAPNSIVSARPPAQIDAVRHSPVVPKPADNVLITARVTSVDALAAVELFHRPDNVNANAVWAAKRMVDDGTGGDVVAGDGIYSAQLTEYKVNGRIVQFYVAARTVNGQTTALPKFGAERPALYVVDSRVVPRDLRVARFVVSEFDLDALSNGNSVKHRFKFPRLSNAYKNATFISNEGEIFYNAEIRNSGSPWTRGGGLDRGKFKLPMDRAFRSHTKFYFDNDPSGGAMYHNRITRYWLYLLGHPASENEFIRLIVNSGSPQIREDTEPIWNDQLDRILPEGSNGELYRIDDEWWFRDSWEQQNRDADWGYKNSENPGRYRTEWMKRTREVEDDFTAIINFFRVVSGNYTQAEVERLIDPEATMKMFAVRGYIDDWDSISLSRGKNGFFYRRPTDGKFQFLQWDSDLTFGNASAALYSGLARVGPYISKPYNLRLLYGYVAEMLEKYTQNSARMEAWFAAEESASPSFSINAGRYRTWFSQRNSFLRQRMGTAYTMAFAITTNSGQPIATTEDTINLTGTAPYGTFRIYVEDHPEASLTWPTATTWSLQGIRLRSGDNSLRLISVDSTGAIRRQVDITVSKTSNAAPVPSLIPVNGSWNIGVAETLRLDARRGFDPDGAPLTLSWRTAPVPSAFVTNDYGLAAAAFAQPGWYSFTLRATDAAGSSQELTREASVHGANGYSSFQGRQLESYWNLENVEPRDNSPTGSHLTLDEAPGALTMQVLNTAALPTLGTGAQHPLVWRALPAGDRWSIQTQVRLDTRHSGNFMTGLLVEVIENGATARYHFGIDGGRSIAVRQATAQGGSTTLSASARTVSEATIRIRRADGQLFFEERIAEVWTLIHSFSVAPEVQFRKGGLFLATTLAESARVHFDYAMLVDPQPSPSPFSDLRLTELMYNPVGGDLFEYVELANMGSAVLDLTGASFTAGISFTFGSFQIQPGERITVARELTAFAARYGGAGGRVIGNFTGRLDNSGERLTLVDASGQMIFSFAYGSSGAWPGRPDGSGGSLELANLSGNPDDSENWRASSEFYGSPGRAGAGPLDSVVINEVLAHSDAPLEDAIELHNPTANAVDVSGWFLSDSRTDYRKFRIPNGTIIPSGGYAVFYEVMFNGESASVPFALSSATGDEIHLVAADAAGTLTSFVDSVEFGPSENGVSLGRHPHARETLVALSRLTFGSEVTAQHPPGQLALFRTGTGSPNAPARVGPVILNQILYHPVDAEHEFIELRNTSAAAVPLFDPQHPQNTWRFQSGIDFAFPPAVTLPPGGRALVTELDPAGFRTRYNIPGDVAVFGPYLGKLDNAGETLALFKPDAPVASGADAGLVPYILVERVRYSNLPPWPTLASGNGPALRRLHPGLYADDPANWTAGDVAPDADSDADGLPDVWEQTHGLNANSPLDAALDLDADGMSNLHEYLNGSDPRDPASRLDVKATLAEQMLTLEFRAMANHAYAVQFRSDISAGAWVHSVEVRAEPASRTAQVRIPASPGAAAGFYRVIVTP
jgi:hypothetical protein